MLIIDNVEPERLIQPIMIAQLKSSRRKVATMECLPFFHLFGILQLLHIATKKNFEAVNQIQQHM